jgi:hypothetical protein
MGAAYWHTFQVLTKRPARMATWVQAWCQTHGGLLPNLWLGTSVEHQAAADERIPHLLRTPAFVRFLSCEPLLGPLVLALEDIEWVISGGESGPRARPADVQWFRDIRDQCLAAGVAYHHKQNGGRGRDKGGRELDGVVWDEEPDAMYTDAPFDRRFVVRHGDPDFDLFLAAAAQHAGEQALPADIEAEAIAVGLETLRTGGSRDEALAEIHARFDADPRLERRLARAFVEAVWRTVAMRAVAYGARYDLASGTLLLPAGVRPPLLPVPLALPAPGGFLRVSRGEAIELYTQDALDAWAAGRGDA